MDFGVIAINFDGWKLVELSLKHSSLKHLWKKRKCLPKLEVINLGNSQQLMECPNLSFAPRVELLILDGCTSLPEVHPSVTKLKRLTILNMKNCKILHYFPSITGLESLKVLNFSGCSKLDKFPEIQGSREVSGNHGGYGMFTKASFRWNIYKELPPSIVYLKGLQSLSLRKCKNFTSLPNSICSLRSLETLIVSSCSKLSKLPEDLGGVVKDQHLTPGFHPFYSDLSGCNLTDRSINDNLGHLRFLEELNLSRNNLVTVPEESPQYLSSSSCLRPVTFKLPNCFALAQDNVATILGKLHQNFLPEIEYSIVLPRSKIPEWFQHPSIGSSVTIELPPNWHNKDFLGFALCSVFSLEEDEIIQGPGLICCNFEFKEGPYLSSSISWTHSGDRVVETDHIWLVYQPGAKLMIPKSSASISSGRLQLILVSLGHPMW
ncbi:Disease resistance-like protein CSA1 [Vitis vinifera]|uniref:Disease resistance-like protein CSA1 n=1 Tax=Vitis vinifera TaxID=29760 RepID=A0A438BMD1_VITVI|nr:Disease resistance-like protein CSA1 [Vitis vinifera]